MNKTGSFFRRISNKPSDGDKATQRQSTVKNAIELIMDIMEIVIETIGALVENL